jgi:cytochrome oxidase Cu insertion factor (SCO1/SenC/PrrC family)
MRLVSVLLLLLLFSCSLNAQTNTVSTESDSSAAYRKNPTIPAFSIQTPDSSWFRKANLRSGKPTLILYFSPDCGHCQLETEEVLSKMRELSNLQIVMITSRPFTDMVNFAEKYKINRFSSIKIGTDPSRMVTQFYDVKFTPFSAVYNSNGKLVKVYEKGIDMPELISLVK